MTNTLIAFFVGTLVGAVLGVFSAALMTAAGDSEIKREKEYQEFINQKGETMKTDDEIKNCMTDGVPNEDIIRSEAMSTEEATDEEIEEFKKYLDDLEDRIKNGRF